MTKLLWWIRQPANLVLLATIGIAALRIVTGDGTWADLGIVAFAAVQKFKHTPATATP